MLLFFSYMINHIRTIHFSEIYPIVPVSSLCSVQFSSRQLTPFQQWLHAISGEGIMTIICAGPTNRMPCVTQAPFVNV